MLDVADLAADAQLSNSEIRLNNRSTTEAARSWLVDWIRAVAGSRITGSVLVSLPAPYVSWLSGVGGWASRYR